MREGNKYEKYVYVYKQNQEECCVFISELDSPVFY